VYQGAATGSWPGTGVVVNKPFVIPVASDAYQGTLAAAAVDAAVDAALEVGVLALLPPLLEVVGVPQLDVSSDPSELN